MPLAVISDSNRHRTAKVPPKPVMGRIQCCCVVTHTVRIDRFLIESVLFTMLPSDRQTLPSSRVDPVLNCLLHNILLIQLKSRCCDSRQTDSLSKATALPEEQQLLIKVHTPTGSSPLAGASKNISGFPALTPFRTPLAPAWKPRHISTPPLPHLFEMQRAAASSTTAKSSYLDCRSPELFRTLQCQLLCSSDVKSFYQTLVF